VKEGHSTTGSSFIDWFISAAAFFMLIEIRVYLAGVYANDIRRATTLDPGRGEGTSCLEAAALGLALLSQLPVHNIYHLLYVE
jgi:hypothetical protein